MFILKDELKPSGDQPKAIQKIVNNIKNGKRNQVLLGATGTGKTFTMANIVKEIQKSTLIIAHNKTLAMQIFSEMKDLFFLSDEIEICYYVSFFDYYRPESYKPSYNVYLEKRTQKNKSIEKMRMNTLKALSTKKYVIVVASVASIYGCIEPLSYKTSSISLNVNQEVNIQDLLDRFSRIGYNEKAKNLIISFDEQKKIQEVEIKRENNSSEFICFSKQKILSIKLLKNNIFFDKETSSIFPVQYIVEEKLKLKKITEKIKLDLVLQLKNLRQENKFIEAKRLEKIVSSDLSDIEEFGFCNGVENYSLYFDGRKIGDPPFTILDFFQKKDFLTIIDESHITIPQIKAMYNTDRNRKKTLVEYGFRLPSALENRPLSFEEFEKKVNNVIYVSATPGKFELEKSSNFIIEQIIRPTGLVDPQIEVRSRTGQINDIVKEIEKQVEKKERVLVYALTILMSENISFFLQEKNIKSVFIHSKMNIFDRYQAISNLRRGVYDVIVGINILKEGIDIPEVSLVCIIDADKSGFLRDHRSLIQIIGRASRNQNGRVIMYADKITKDMKNSIEETIRRRQIQSKHNELNSIIPKTINKKLLSNVLLDQEILKMIESFKISENNKEKEKIIKKMEKIIKSSVKEFNFDKAIEIRNIIFDLKADINKDQ